MASHFLDEQTTKLYQGTFKNSAGVVIPPSNFSTLVLTYYDVASDAIINGRNEQNVLNANNCTLSGAGLFTWEIQPVDLAVQNTSLAIGVYEHHKALFEWTLTNGSQGKREDDIFVRNWHKVP